MDGSFSLAQRLGRRVGAEAVHLLAIIILLVPALHVFFCVLSFGQDHSLAAFLTFCQGLWQDADGRAVLPQLWRGLRVSFALIGGSLAIAIPLAIAAGWWGSVDPRAGGLKLFLTLVSCVPAFAYAYAFQQFSNALLFPILTLAISDLMLSLAASHVMKELSVELRRSYVRTAKVKGVSPFKHYWRRLAVEVLCVTKSRIAYLIGGTVVVERIFSLRGLGNMAILAVKRNPPDLSLLLWICLVSVVSVYLINLCEAVLRDFLIPSSLDDQTSPGLGERLSAARAWLARLFRPGEKGSGTFCRERPEGCFAQKVPDPFSPAAPRSASSPRPVPPSPRRAVALFVRLRGLWSYSATSRVKCVLGVALWSCALIALLAVLAAGPLSHTGILGVTYAGHDALGATLLAGRRLLLPILLGAAIPILLGIVLGACVGYFRFSLLGRAVEYAMNLLDAMPKLVLAMIFAVIVKTDALYLYKVIPFMGFTFTPIIYDLVRKRVEYLQRMNFVETERALGAGPSRILFLHILFNNCRSLVSVHGVHLLGQIVLLDAAFDYLGLAQPEHYTWGALFYNSIYDAFMGGEANPWAWLAPLAAILISVLALTTLSEGLEAVLEPPLQEAT